MVRGEINMNESLELRQQAVVVTALAYFDKGHSAQYDGASICDVPRVEGGRVRSTNMEPPEYATPDETLYSVCSDFCHQVYWEALRYSLTGRAGSCTTMALCATPKDRPSHLYHFEKADGGDVNDAVTEILKLAQPGDIYVSMSDSGAGHAMIYVGDVFGDGKTYFAHCFGKSYKMDTGIDTVEYGPDLTGVDETVEKIKNYQDSNGGAIRISEAEPMLRKSYCKGNQAAMTLLRPLLEIDAETFPIPPATRTRLGFPRLSIDRTAGASRFHAVRTGETLPLRIRLKNGSGTAYTLSVVERIPAGVAFAGASEGGTVKDGGIRWDVTLDAGECRTLVVDYTVTAARGEEIVFTGGCVGGIPSNTIPVTVGGARLTEEENAHLAAIAEGAYREALAGATDETLGQLVWEKVLGLPVQLPRFDAVPKTLLEENAFGVKSLVFKKGMGQAERSLLQMLVPRFWGGRNLWIPRGGDCARDPRYAYLEPGDTLVRIPDATEPTECRTLVFLGGRSFLQVGENGVEITDHKELEKSLTYGLYYCIRPTLAWDDVHTGS